MGRSIDEIIAAMSKESQRRIQEIAGKMAREMIAHADSLSAAPCAKKGAGAKKPLWLHSTVTQFLEEQARRDEALPGDAEDSAEITTPKISQRSRDCGATHCQRCNAKA